ncbi:MAG: hypothetical protein GMKNLPBB_00686 [Myxococcota bacterium]|nr:hypothetical protein [Myxococcota bacterium]
MVMAVDQMNWRSLGTGFMSPARSVADQALMARITNYKTQVAGRYRSVAPQAITSQIASGVHVASPKIDGETWFHP